MIENIYKIENKIIAGIDEVGRGPLAGPVVACAFIASSNDFIENVDDSKKLSIRNREKIYSKLIEDSVYAIGEATIEEIEEFNISNATKLAINRAVQNLSIESDIILVDGNMKFEDKKYQSIIKGDTKIYQIAAASIIAKIYRDNLMRNLAKIHPEYGWEKNVGYGTKLHIEAIKKYGKSKFHRESFLKKICV